MMGFSHRRTLSPSQDSGAILPKAMAQEIVDFSCGQCSVNTVSIANNPVVFDEAINDAFINNILAPEETWTLTALTDSTFSVTGSVSGVIDGIQSQNAVTECATGLLYTNGLIQFTIPDRDYVAGDSMTLMVSHGVRRLTISAYFGAGSGILSGLNYFKTTDENFTVVALNATTFTVTGSVSGSMPNLTVGQRYNSGFNPSITQLSIIIQDGLEDFVAGDQFLLAGSYSVLPQDDRWQVLSGMGGTPSYNNTSNSSDFKVMLRGQGMIGVGPVFVGFQTNSIYNFNLGTSNGTDYVAGALQNLVTAYTPMPEDASFNAFMRVTRRNIVAGFNVGQSYSDQLYVGLLKSFLAPGAHPYPVYQAGTYSNFNSVYPYNPSPSDGSSGLSHGHGKYMRNPGLDTVVFGRYGYEAMYPSGYQRSFVPIDVSEVNYIGIGDGILEEARREHFDIPRDLITVTALSASTFSVSGANQGPMASGVVGTEYRNGGYLFTVQSGSTDFQAGDQFTVSVLPQELLIPLSLNQYGELEGCYMASEGTQPGDIIIIDGVDYLVSGDLATTRNTKSHENRFAIRMD
tara:strand:- start:3658 stop:5373 length:1716 start_codon:yes stop_codon:yes gene_type:complete